jgi:hypothetical protein
MLKKIFRTLFFEKLDFIYFNERGLVYALTSSILLLFCLLACFSNKETILNSNGKFYCKIIIIQKVYHFILIIALISPIRHTIFKFTKN